MKNEELFYNPFKMLSPKLTGEIEHMEGLYEKPVSDELSLQEGLLVMTSKLIEMCRMLSKCIVTGSEVQMARCETFVNEIRAQEKILTKEVLESNLKGKLMKGLIRFPYRLERISEMLESILLCCRDKAASGTPFSEKAHSELDQIFNVLMEMMVNLRDGFRAPNRVILEAVIAGGKRTAQLIEDSKLAHWERLEAGFCSVDASSVFRAILDSAKSANEYLVKLADTLLSLASETTE